MSKFLQAIKRIFTSRTGRHSKKKAREAQDYYDYGLYWGGIPRDDRMPH